MKIFRFAAYLTAFGLVVLAFNGCKKDDPDKVRREKYTELILNDINADSLQADVTWLQDMGTRFALAPNHREVALRLKKRFEGMGFQDVKTDSFHIVRTYRSIVYDQMQYNVIVTVPGTKYPDSLCIAGAHYDDVLGTGDPLTAGRGANDNASGVAALMEIARAFSREDFKPETTVKFIAFGAEELGLLGSYDYASDPEGFENSVRFMLNFDMIAYEVSPPSGWIVNILDYDNSHVLRREAEELGARYTNLLFTNNNSVNNRSDSYPFYLQGYKALFFFSNDSDPNYHTLNDVTGNCNFSYCREVVKVAAALLVNKN